MTRFPAWAALLLALAAASIARADPPNVRTDREKARVLPLPKEEGVFHFVVYGDRTGGPAEGIEVLKRAVRDTNLLGPDLVMTVGDLIQGYNATERWTRQMREYRGVMSGLVAPWYPVAGNHDIYWRGGKAPPGHHEADYEEHFGPLWYWFPHKEAAFVVLYTDEGDRERNRKGFGKRGFNRMGGEQLAWLRKTLVETRRYDHVFVFLHHPRWWSEYYPKSNWGEVHTTLKQAGNVTAVFAGHIHRRRFEEKDGITYYALGTTGGGVPFVAPGTGYLHHLDVVTVRKSGITIGTIPVGRVLDPRDMTPERWTEIDLLCSTPPVLTSGPILVHGDGSALGTLGVLVQNPTARSIELTLGARAGDSGTWFRPDHAHLTLEPGGREEVTFAYERHAAAGGEWSDTPSIAVRRAYLAESLRVELPELTVTPEMRLADVPAPATTGPDRCLDLGARGASLDILSSALHAPDGPLTLEAWLRAPTFQGRRGLVAKTEVAEFGLFVSDGKPHFAVFLGKHYAIAESETPLLESDRWHHIAGVYDGSEVRVYLDGKRVAAAPGSGKRRRNGLPFVIGADVNKKGRPTSHFGGLLDEVRLSTVARYAGASFEPARRFEPDADTALLLHCDRHVGPFAPDAGPRKAHAIGRGPVRYVERAE